MVATETIRDELHANGIVNTKMWTRGVDLELFRPRDKALFDDLPRPALLYVGRVAIEKNIEAFLKLDVPGSKVVVGDGPQLAQLRGRFPDVRFCGPKFGEELAAHFAAADLFVFPSLTDTFGLVLLEAMASGLPVAAYPVPGPLDVVTDPAAGALDADLGTAVQRALSLSPDAARNHALGYSWEACARTFLDNLHPFGVDDRQAA